MSQITSYDALSQELNLAYEKAIQRFPDRTDDIDDVFEAADEVYKSLRLIDKFIDEMDSKWAAETGQKFMWLTHRLSSCSTHSKDLFTWRDMPVSWRNSAVKNIVSAIEIEAGWYMFHFDSFLFHDGSPDNQEYLLSLRTQIRKRTEKDDNAEGEVVGHKPQGLPGLVDVLCTLAAHWVLCECGIEIGQAGIDGWQKKGLQLGRKIALLKSQIQVIEPPFGISAQQADSEQLEAQLKAVTEECAQAHGEADAYRECFGASREFCARACGIGAPELFNAALVGFDPTRLKPGQGPSTDRMSEIVSHLKRLPRDEWKLQPWAIRIKPRMSVASRVTQDKQDSFIVRNLKHVVTMSEPSGQDKLLNGQKAGDEWLPPRTVAELAQETGCSRTTINDEVKNGDIPGGAFRENNRPRGNVILQRIGLDYLKRKGGKDKQERR